MINMDCFIKNFKEQNPTLPKIPDHPHIVITGGSVLEKTNALLNLVKFICTVKIPITQNTNY